MAKNKFTIALLRNPDNYDNFAFTSSKPYNFFNILVGVSFPRRNSLSGTLNAMYEYINHKQVGLIVRKHLDKGHITIESVNKQNDFNITINQTRNNIALFVENTASPRKIKIIKTDIISENNCNTFTIEVTADTTIHEVNAPKQLNNTLSNRVRIRNVKRNDLTDTLISIAHKNDGFISYATDKIYVPNLSAAHFKIRVLQKEYKSSIQIQSLFTKQPFFNCVYSIDGVKYQNNSTFQNIPPGKYTLYIKDSLGCIVKKSFTISELTFTKDIKQWFKFSPCSSFINIKSTNNKGDIFNTHSTDKIYDVNIQCFQPFQQNDGLLTQQFQTSYDNVRAYLYDVDTKTQIKELEIKKILDLYNLIDTRHAQLFDVKYNNFNYVGIKFLGGNIFNPDKSIKSEYFDNRTAPHFYTRGQYVSINGYYYKILDIINHLGHETVILDLFVTDTDLKLSTNLNLTINHKVSIRFNYEDFNIYEYYVDPRYLNGNYTVITEIFDPHYEDQYYYTEVFNIKPIQPKTFHVVAYHRNDTNHTIFSKNSQFVIRIPYETDIIHKSKEDIKYWKNNEKIITSKVKIENNYELHLQPIDFKFKNKIVSVLSLSHVFINDLSYILTDISNKKRIGQTNTVLDKLIIARSNKKYDRNGIFNDDRVKYVLGTGNDLENVLGIE